MIRAIAALPLADAPDTDAKLAFMISGLGGLVSA